ncbi:MAG: ROK family protein [Planctomycetaceae bacterium]|nr:ROK family protein [Planctomycetaceae bacterium]
MEAKREYWLGFDLGGTKMLAQVYDADWKVIGRERKRTKPGSGATGGLDRVIETTKAAIEDAGITCEQLRGIGIGCPGPVDMDNGILLQPPNLGWETVNVKQRMESIFSCPVAVVNDADAGIYAEYRKGAAQGARCVIGVFCGTGIGGGCVYQGEILQGANGASCFEIGHVQVMSNGPRCGCGQRGCLESVASRLAIASQCARAAYHGDAPYLLEKAGTDLANIRSGALANAVKQGDEGVKDVVREAARYIGIAIGSVVNLMNPDVVILGGGMVEAMPEIFVDRVARSANKRAMPAFRDKFAVKPAALMDDAGVLGAALWAEHVLGGTPSAS